MKRLYGRIAFVAIMFMSVVGSTVLAEESPASLIRAEVARVLAVAQDKRLDVETRRAKLRQIIGARFDFEDMSQRVLAVRWEKATPQQREDFVRLFKKLLEVTYFRAIESYTSETVNVGGERLRGDNATVIVTIVRADGTDIPLLLKLKKNGQGWLAYDANIEGVSLVNNYRNSFGEVARNYGMDGLLLDIQRRIAAEA